MAVTPVTVEVLTYAPTVFYHCQHCEMVFQRAGIGDRVHREQAKEALPDDLRAEFDELSHWVHDTVDRFGDRIRIKIVDAASIEGFLKSLRHRIGRYPTVVIDGKEKIVGKDYARLQAVLEARLGPENQPPMAAGKEVFEQSDGPRQTL
jgi:hypothetical protein